MFDLASPIICNAFTFSQGPLTTRPMSGVVIERIEPTDIETAFYMDKRALDEGVDAGDIYLAQRAFIIHASIYGTSEGAAWDRYDDLVTAFAPRLMYNADSANLGFLAFQFIRPSIDTAFPSGISMQAYLRSTRPPIIQVSRRKQGGYTGSGTQIPVIIPMVARDPRFYLQTAQTVTISAGDTTYAAPHRGTYPTWPTFNFTCTGAGHTNMAMYVGSYFVRLELGPNTGTTAFSVDFALRRCTRAGIVDNSYLSDWDVTVFSEVQPGGSNLQIANATNLSAMSATYREAWL